MCKGKKPPPYPHFFYPSSFDGLTILLPKPTTYVRYRLGEDMIETLEYWDSDAQEWKPAAFTKASAGEEHDKLLDAAWEAEEKADLAEMAKEDEEL